MIKKVKRVGHGFRNFAYRLRLLLHCGVRWQTHRTAGIARPLTLQAGSFRTAVVVARRPAAAGRPP